MTRIFYILLLLSIFSTASAQLFGTKSIPGDYATVALAVADLNTNGVGAGGVTFNIAAGHVENLTARIAITATGTMANPIVFQKSGTGDLPVLNAYQGTNTPTSAARDGLISLQGSDYVTIDGIELKEAATNSTPTQLMEYGIGLFRASATDGAQNNTIKNCKITLSRENDAAGSGVWHPGSNGIVVLNCLATANTAVTPTSALGSNSFNKFYSNTIENVIHGITFISFAAPTPFTLGDTGNDVGGSSALTGNTIINFGGKVGSTATADAVFVNNQWSFNCSYNTINNNNGAGVNHPNALRGIWLNASSTSASATINNNNITLYGGGTTHPVTAIENALGSTAASNTVTINNNYITGNYLTATTGLWYGIFNSATAANVVIQGNTIENVEYSANTLAGSGLVYPIFNSGAGTNILARNNTINNIQRFGSSGANTIGIYFSAGTNQTIKNNFIYDISIDGTGTVSLIYGIQVTATTVVVDSNIVRKLSCKKTTGTGNLYGIYNIASASNENYNYNQIDSLEHLGTGTTYGLFSNTVAGVRSMSFNTIHTLSTNGNIAGGIVSTASVPTIQGNKIYNIESKGAAATTSFGISVTTTSGTSINARIFNNVIGDLRTPNTSVTAANTNPQVRGISYTAATVNANVNISFNTVYLNATSTGINFGSAALFVAASTTATTSALDLRNNIFINNSTPNGNGRTVAYQRNGVALNNYTNLSNNNSFFAGTPSSTNLIFTDGTNNDQNITDFKTRVAPREGASFTETITFLSLNGADSTFLYPDPAVGTQLESGGLPITAITTDFKGTVRNVNTPDIGAIEFNGIAVDLSAPSISLATLSAATICTTNRTITATITDASGVNITPGLKPRLWFKKDTENDVLPATNTSASNGWKWVEASNNTSPFSFTFNFGLLSTPLLQGDSITYFITAQDSLTTPNVAATVVTLNDVPTSVALGLGSFPVTGNARGFLILNEPIPLLVKISKTELCLKGTVTLDVDGIDVRGGEYQWQRSPFNANTWTDITNGTTIPFTTDTISAPTDFRLVIRCGGTPISSSPSNTVSLAINNPQITSTTPATRCGVGQVTLSAVAADPSATIKWYATPNATTALFTGDTYTTPTLNTSTTYYVSATEGGTGSISIPGDGGWNHVTTTGAFQTSLITGSSMTLTVSAPLTLSSLDIYPSAPIGTAFTIEARTVSASGTTFLSYAGTTSVTNSGTPSVAQTVPVNFVLPVGTYYIGFVGTNPNTWRSGLFAHGLPWSIPGVVSMDFSLTPNYQYYFYNLQISNGCEGARVPVTATLTSPPAITVGSPLPVICENATAALNVNSANTNYVYTWTPANLNGSSVNVTPTATTKYFVSAVDAVTNCTAVDSITVFVQPTPTISATPPSFCVTGGVATLRLTPSTGYANNSIQWQVSTNNISYNDIVGADSTVYVTPSITSTTYYKALIKNGANVVCSDTGYTVLVSNPALTGTTVGSRCGPGTVQLQATANTGNEVNWYASSTGGSPLFTGATFTTPSINSTTTFYAAPAAPNSGSGTVAVGAGATTSATYSNPFYTAWSNTHNQHIVLASELTAAGILPGAINAIGLDVTSAGTLPMIDFSLKIGTTTATTMSAFVATSSFATVYTSASLMPTTGVNMLTFTTPFYWDGVSNIVLEICHGNPSSTATMSRTVTADATSYISSIHTHKTTGTAGSAQCTDNLTNLLTYSVRPRIFFTFNAGCEAPRTAVIATINTPPTISRSATPAVICEGQSTQLTTSSSNAGYSYTWTPVNLTGTTVNVSPTQTTKYFVSAIDNSAGTFNGCTALDSIVVRVNTKPSEVFVTPTSAALCANTNPAVALTVSGGTVGGEFTFGTQAAQNTATTYPAPYSVFYGGQRMQMLITAAELIAKGVKPGQITKISFPVVSLGTNWGTATTECQNFKISLGSTALTSLTAFQSSLTEVLSAGNFTPVVGYSNEHTFTTPFTWDGTSNLIIETTFSNNKSGVTADGVVQYNSPTSYQSTIVYRADGVTATAAATATTIDFSFNARPDFKLVNAQNTLISWAPLTGLFTNAAATTPYTGGNATTVYAKPVTTTTYTATSTSDSGCIATKTVTITDNCAVPVTITAFKGEKRGSINQLSWTTSTEVNNAGFEMQRSADGVNYTALGFIGSKADNGNSNQVLNYSFNDERPLSSTGYYRLKQIDKDGKYNYSQVVVLKSDRKGDFIVGNIYPNPVSSILNVSIESTKNAKVEIVIVNTLGMKVHQQSANLVTGQNIQTMNINRLAAGLYHVQMITPNGEVIQAGKVTKQ